MTKRIFVKQAVGLLFLSLLCFDLLAAAVQKPIMNTDVVVVGAGYSGLLAARTVAKAGYNVVILEARDRVGGRAYSVPLGHEAVADLGAGWVISPTHARMIALAKEYGVTLYPTYIKGDGLTIDGTKLHRVPMSHLMFSPDTPPEHLKPAALVINKLVAMSQSLDTTKPWTFPDAEKLDNTTFLEWLNTHYPQLDTENLQIVERTIDGYIGPLSSTSILNVLAYAKMSHGFQNYSNMQHWLRIEGGVASIAQKIETELRKNPNVTILLNQHVYRIHSLKNEAMVYSPGATVHSKRVIVAVPPMVATGIDFGGQLQNTQQKIGSALAMSQRVIMMPGFKAVFVFKTPFWRKQGLSGYAVSATEPVGAVWDASPEHGKVGCLIMLSNPFITNPKLIHLTPSDRKQLLASSLKKFFGDEALHYIHYVEKTWDADSFALGSVGVPAVGSWVTYGEFLRAPSNVIYWASSERATWSWAQMDGAVESGMRTGQDVVASLHN